MKEFISIILAAMILITAVPAAMATQSPIAVEGAYWFSTNSTEPVSPGYSYVPLIVAFVPLENLFNLNISLNYSSLKDEFSYSYVHGPDREVRDYFNFPEASAGDKYYIYQLTNISSNLTDGMYEIPVDYAFQVGNITITGEVNATVPVLGTIRLVSPDSFFGSQNAPVAATSFMNNVPVTVYLEEDGNSPVTNVTVSYKPQYPFSGQAQEEIVSAIQSYSYVPLTFFVNTGPSGLVVKQFMNVSFLGTSTIVPFTVRLSGFPYVVQAGSQLGTTQILPSQGMKNIPITFFIEEDSPVPVQNVTVHFSPNYPLSGPEQSFVISALPSYSPVGVTFLVNITGDQSVFNENLTLYYNDSLHVIEYKVILPGYSNISLLTYFTNPPIIYQGQEFIQLDVILVNGGNSFSPPLNVSLSSEGFEVLTAPYSFPPVPAGKVLNLTFLINAENATGNETLLLHVNDKTFFLHEMVYSKGSVSVQSSNISVVSGSSSNLFSFVVKNTGNVTLVDLQFHILTPDIFSIHIPSSNPLGGLTANNITFSQLSPGKEIIVTFVIDVSSAAKAGSYPSELFLTYRTNNSSVEFMKTFTFNVTVEETALQELSSLSGITYAAIAIAIILIIVFSVIMIRRRKR
ncbi:MAG: hypothetical protein QW578_08300 [Thermoplasmatales archaeon]